MGAWQSPLKGNPIAWLLEPENPSVRSFALRDLLAHPQDDPEVWEARRALMSGGPVAAILGAQHPEGYWDRPGPGYGPKYRGTVWQVTFLAQLGADGNDPRVSAACGYLLQNNVATNGRFSVNGTPSAAIHCLEGNLGAALIDLGCLGEARLQQALENLARSVTGDGFSSEKDAPLRYYRSGNSGPDFACAANNHQPCAWGAVKAMLALSKVPPEQRTSAMNAAVDAGVNFLLRHDVARADYPTGWDTKPSSSWFKFGFPIAYVTDLLQLLEALAALDHGRDARLKEAITLVLSKQDPQGRWPLEYTYNGKTWVDIESKGKPSKWVTLRALRVLKGALA